MYCTCAVYAAFKMIVRYIKGQMRCLSFGCRTSDPFPAGQLISLGPVLPSTLSYFSTSTSRHSPRFRSRALSTCSTRLPGRTIAVSYSARLTLSRMDFLKKYESFIFKNATQVSSIESTLRSLTYILPGKRYGSLQSCRLAVGYIA
jgi:hypothetical protein